MLDPDTFLTHLYVMADECCKGQLPAEGPRPGPPPALTRGEVVALALFGQRGAFGSERGCYRDATRHLRPAFPTLPDRSQCNRLLRAQRASIAACGHHLAALGAPDAPSEAPDCSGLPTRNAKRRGAGWLAGLADSGRCGRCGWFAGCQLLVAATATGALTGDALAPASTKEQPSAEDFLAARRWPDPRCPGVGTPSGAPSVADNGCVGAARHRRWREAYGARVICPPQRSAPGWSPALRRWHAGLRQIVEAVCAKLHRASRLDRERPHALDGLQARLAAKVALHNFCLWLNRQLDRPPLAFADLLAW